MIDKLIGDFEQNEMLLFSTVLYSGSKNVKVDAYV